LIRISAATFGLIAALLLAGLPHAGGSELLANGGFEEGSSGWSVFGGDLSELLAVSAPVHEGALAGRFSGGGQPTTQFIYQWINVQPNQSYELSGWAAALGDAVNGVFLRISWFDLNDQLIQSVESSWLPQRDGIYYLLATGPVVAPADARSAHVRVYVLANPNTPFSVHLDDFAFSGPAAIPPPPPTSPPATTPAPVVTPTPQPPIATPTRTPRRTQTPAPRPTSDSTGDGDTTPAAEPTFFDQLVNGGFEEVRPDGTPFGWQKQGGEMSTVSDPRTEGTRAAALTSATTSTKWLYQTVAVRGGAHYEASIDARAGPGLESVFLRLSWYNSADGSGTAIDSVDSLETATPADAGFTRLSTGVVEAPPGADSVKVRLMLRPSSEQTATAYFDSAMLLETTAGVQAAREGVSGGAVSAAGRRGGADAVPGESSESQPTGATPVRLANVKPPQADGSSPLAAGSGGGDGWAIPLALGTAAAAIGIAGGYEVWQRRRGGESDTGAN